MDFYQNRTSEMSSELSGTRSGGLFWTTARKVLQIKHLADLLARPEADVYRSKSGAEEREKTITIDISGNSGVQSLIKEYSECPY